MANRATMSVQGSRSPSPHTEEVRESPNELLHSDHDEDPEVSFHPRHTPVPLPNPVGPPSIPTGMYMPYIEGPQMDWIVNDDLYHCFLKWHLKCENILECKLAALPEHQKCKKVIAWSGNCGMDQYVSWNLPSSELTLDIIWGKYEEYCKVPANLSFCQGKVRRMVQPDLGA